MATIIPLNRCVLDAAEIVRASGALFSGEPSLRIDGVGIDTRTLWPGALFVALRGVRDGHAFLDAAADKGAAAAIVERGRRHGILPCFEVDDTLRALGALARNHLERVRSASSLPVVAIGGAAGKTTTKEFAAALMRTLFGEILATPGNLNNLIGLPMTLLTLTEGQRAAVLECGTNQPGEIARLAAILRPDVALVLNVDIEHTERLGSLDGVADEEAALFLQARCAIVPFSEKLLLKRLPARMRTVTFGSEANADVQLISRVVLAPGRQQVKLKLPPQMVESTLSPYLETTLSLVGEPIAENAAAAVAAAAVAWGRPLKPDQLAALGAALAAVRGEPGRLSVREQNGVVIIDDSYNANPRSVRAALRAARETADMLHTRLVVALGDMLELGELSPMMHADAVRDTLDARPDEFIAVGREFMAAVSLLTPSLRVRTKLHMASDSTEAAVVLRRVISPGDVLLVKGSRGIEMERVVDGLHG
ncbi:MAG: UDP-N-acetylmuramoyl-tripeptide--D-alanyl-D-alanine ligase [Deltaproteobacteria bacterium]|nr:UDP-N-acetylmuramoyl-tripeptide--D-alanyl-D-alanine ligase [Deltaproteobacteria bacterium]